MSVGHHRDSPFLSECVDAIVSDSDVCLVGFCSDKIRIVIAEVSGDDHSLLSLCSPDVANPHYQQCLWTNRAFSRERRQLSNSH